MVRVLNRSPLGRATTVLRPSDWCRYNRVLCRVLGYEQRIIIVQVLQRSRRQSLQHGIAVGGFVLSIFANTSVDLNLEVAELVQQGVQH